MADGATFLRACLVLLGLYFSTQGGPQTAVLSFPLDKCRTEYVDLLLVAGGLEPQNTTKSGWSVQKLFFQQLLHLFLMPEELTLSRLRVGLISLTSSGPVSHISFQDYDRSDELESAIFNADLQDEDEENLQSWSVETFVGFMRRTFSEEGRSKETVKHAVIVVSDDHLPWTVTSVRELFDEENQDNMSLFMILVGLLEGELNSALTQIKEVLLLPSYQDLLNTQLIPMALCKTCMQGWLWFEHGDTQPSQSCYLLHVSMTSVTWPDAAQICEQNRAELASLETQKEIDNMETSLNQFFRSLRFSYPLDRPLPEVVESVFIGLVRGKETQAKRFRWLNRLPLVYTHWFPERPNGGLTFECGAWYYVYSDMNFTETVNGTFVHGPEPPAYDDHYIEGWKDIGCGYYATPYTLCEVNFPNHRVVQDNVIHYVPASKTRFEAALRHTEVMELSGQIVSIPANVDNPQILDALADSNIKLNLFSCEDGGYNQQYIPYSYVCDHIRHCSNGRDEEICLYRRCDPMTEFQCVSSQCVPQTSWCDVYVDCIDGSDESDCLECRGKRCCDGTCLPKHWFFDGETDCTGCSPEFLHFFLGGKVTDENIWFFVPEDRHDDCVFTCNRSECIFPHQLNDGFIDCQGPEGPLDETFGKLETIASCVQLALKYVKWSPRCVYIKDRYGGVLGCRDMTHLHNCENFTCPEGYVKCPQSYCIPLHLVRDGNLDCPMGEDEQFSENQNCSRNFACRNSKLCLHPDLICDGRPHCPSGDDELNCHVTCADGFHCIGGTVIIKDLDNVKPLQSLAFVDVRTRYLDLSAADLSSPFTKHNRGKFINLIEVRLINSQLTNALGEFVFDIRGLETVYLLDLSYNFIREITEDSMFKYMTNLRVLNLSHNRELSLLHKGGLSSNSGASPLENLDLSDTNISFIDQAFFQSLTNLKYLNLSFTHISRLNKLSTFPENFKLYILDLRRTPLHEIDAGSFNSLSIQSHLYTDNYKLCCSQVRGPGVPEYTCHAPLDAISSCSDLVGEIGQRLLIWVVGVIAILGNVVVLTYRLILDREAMKMASGIFTTNLGVSDFSMGVYLLIIATADMHFRDTYVWNEEWWRQSVLCKITGFLSTLSSETSTFFIFLITVDRFMIIKYPFGRYRFSRTMTTISCVSAWSFGCILAFVPLLPSLTSWSLYSSNGMCLGLPLTPEKKKGWGYSVAIFIVLNSVMFIVIAFGQLLIFRAMSDNRIPKSSVVQSNSRRVQDIMVAKQLALVALSNFLCWFPIGLMGLLALGGHDLGRDAYAWSAVLVLPINSALNPLLYTVPILLAKWEKFKTGNPKQSSRKTLSTPPSNGTGTSPST